MNGPKGASFDTSPSGWMETVNFTNWFKKIFRLFADKLEGPKIVFFDGHGSHISIGLIESAKQGNIHLVKLPPHTTHFLQPLDVLVFKTIKQKWKKAVENHFLTEKCKNIDKPDFPKLLNATITSCN